MMNYQPEQCTKLEGKSHKITILDPPKMGNVMTPVETAEGTSD